MRRFVFVLVVLASSTALFCQQPAPPSNPAALFDKGMNALMGTGPGRSDLTAVDYFRRSAELGYAPAQNVMGYFSEAGGIVPKDPQQAADWYRKAALQGDGLAAYLLGRLYFNGSGVVRDLNQAEHWLGPAAEQGNPFAEYLLGLARHERGDFSAAAHWFQSAAEQGLPRAQHRLGTAFQEGRGVESDKFQAYVWLLLSFEAGDPSSADALKQLEAELGTTQVEQAKIKARKLQQTTSRLVTAHGCEGWPGELDSVPTPPPPNLQRYCR